MIPFFCFFPSLAAKQKKKETAKAVSFFRFAAREEKRKKIDGKPKVLLYNGEKLCYYNSARLSCIPALRTWRTHRPAAQCRENFRKVDITL